MEATSEVRSVDFVVAITTASDNGEHMHEYMNKSLTLRSIYYCLTFVMTQAGILCFDDL